MEVLNTSEVPKQHLEGPIVEGDMYLQALTPSSKDFTVFNIDFVKGARNKMHKHACDQVLIVTAGKGIVKTRTEERTVGPGDVIVAPAGEEHWHGAVPDSDFTHIAIVTPASLSVESRVEE